MKIRFAPKRRVSVIVQRANGWNLYDSRGVVHWAADEAVDDQVRYLTKQGCFVRKERVWR